MWSFLQLRAVAGESGHPSLDPALQMARMWALCIASSIPAPIRSTVGRNRHSDCAGPTGEAAIGQDTGRSVRGHYTWILLTQGSGAWQIIISKHQQQVRSAASTLQPVGMTWRWGLWRKPRWALAPCTFAAGLVRLPPRLDIRGSPAVAPEEKPEFLAPATGSYR